MAIYLYWGEDDFAMRQAVETLRDRTLDPQWVSFNYEKIPPEQPDAVIQALNQAMTAPFGMGSRFVWLADTTICQRCSEDLLSELERTLPDIPETTVLLLTTQTKPDGRIRSTKLLQKYAEIREFSSIPPWKTEQITQRVRQAADEVGVKLTTAAMELLAQSVGNDTRHLFSELEKLRLYAGATAKPLDQETVASLVVANTQNSLQLADSIRRGDTAQSLALVADLLNRNEPALRIVATLVGQFRLWLWVKLMMESGERDERAIARVAELSNPKRIYFLQKNIQFISSQQLRQTLPLLLELEFSLKTQGMDEITSLQTKTVELCRLYSVHK